jgi:hypothetical protein
MLPQYKNSTRDPLQSTAGITPKTKRFAKKLQSKSKVKLPATAKQT